MRNSLHVDADVGRVVGVHELGELVVVVDDRADPVVLAADQVAGDGEERVVGGEGAVALEAADGREAYALLKGGALSGLSVGFRTLKEKAGANGGKVITEAELFEVSLVAVPSNPITKISAVKGIGNVRDLEELLREHGMSSRQAKRAANAAFRAADEVEGPAISETASKAFAAAINDLSRFTGAK